VAVEVVAGAVVAHGGAGVGVACGDLDITQVDASVQHGGDKGVPSARTRSVRSCSCSDSPGGSLESTFAVGVAGCVAFDARACDRHHRHHRREAGAQRVAVPV
jgi:hypothetical protein